MSMIVSLSSRGESRDWLVGGSCEINSSGAGPGTGVLVADRPALEEADVQRGSLVRWIGMVGVELSQDVVRTRAQERISR